MKRLLLLVLALVMLFSLAACDSGSGGESESEDETTAASGAEGSQVEATEPDVSTYTIKAGGLELKYPEKWKDKVTVDVTDDKAAFTCGKVNLFDILFNSEEGTVLGTVKKDDEYIVLTVVDYELKKADTDLAEMQTDLNVILNFLEADYDFTIGERLSEVDDSTFEIKTSVVTLQYPAKWQDKVTVKVEDDVVKFSDGDTPIFDLILKKSDKGYLLGTYKDTPIYVIDYPVESDDDMAMQADINVIIKYLQEDENFTIAS